MKGVILTNAYSSFPEADYQPRRLKEEFAKLGVTVDVLKNDFFPVAISENRIENKLSGYDFCIYLDKDKYKKMCENAYTAYNKKFTASKMTKTLEAIYEKEYERITKGRKKNV